MPKLILTILIFILPIFSHSTTSTDKPVKTMAFVNGLLMASPITPIQMEPKAGRHSLSFRPLIFEGDSGGVQTYDGARWQAEFKGQGLALMYHWQAFSFAGVYVLGMYNQLTEGTFLGRGSDPTDPQQDVLSTEVNANFLQVSAGFTLYLLKSKYFSAQLIAGPTLTSADASQRVTQEHPANPDDFIMNISPSISGALVGLQTGIRLLDNLILSPYFQLSVPFGETCVEYTTEITTNGDLNNLSDPSCNGANTGPNPLIEYDTSFEVVGLNLILPHWGLSFNLLSEVGEIQGIEGTETTLFFVTVTL